MILNVWNSFLTSHAWIHILLLLTQIFLHRPNLSPRAGGRLERLGDLGEECGWRLQRGGVRASEGSQHPKSHNYVGPERAGLS